MCAPGQDMQEKQKVVMQEMLRPDACMQFMRPGRLVHIRDGPLDWSWGVLVRPRRDGREAADQTARPGTEKYSYILDVLLICSLKTSKSKSSAQFCQMAFRVVFESGPWQWDHF